MTFPSKSSRLTRTFPEVRRPLLSVPLRDRSKRGVALVVTLVTLSILVVLLVSFVGSMTIERQAAHAFEDTQRAKMIAQGAVSHAVDLLRTNIPEPALISETVASAPSENWVINPGRLTVFKNGTTSYIPLHTGEVTTLPSSGPRDADSVDLNAPLPGDTIPVITGTAAEIGKQHPPMRVRWVNLRSDPAADPSATNPLIGRYAFWVDDECAKVNFNTALGKPAYGSDAQFDDQYYGKGTAPAAVPSFVTPLFVRGDSSTVYSGGGVRRWALGRPQSVNLDSYFSQPNQLLADKLVDYTFLHGFARYPEAILDFINVPDAKGWFNQHRFDLTFYNRSPEFNSFGKSRLFTSFVPLSLEGGPNYQNPFVYSSTNAFSDADPNSLNLHLNSLLGAFGAGAQVVDDDGTTASGNRLVNQLQVKMIMDYLTRRWPEYGNKSFVDKYTTAGCWQIALNALLMARMATAPLTDNTGTTDQDLVDFSHDWALRTTSVNYIAGDSTYMSGQTPERFYWGSPDQQVVLPRLMLPQIPGPYVTEVRLIVQVVDAEKKATKDADDYSAPPSNDPTTLTAYTRPVYIQYQYEVEYYMPPTGPVVDLSEFPIRMDYLNLSATGPNQKKKSLTRTQSYTAANWNQQKTLARLVTLPKVGTRLGPVGAAFGGASVPNRRTVSSQWFTVGQRAAVVPLVDDTNYGDWDPQPFEADGATTNATLALQFRPGMGIAAAVGRPRQMIPLGTTAADTLQAQFSLPLPPDGKQLAMSWQIVDPRLSSDLKQWTAYGPGPESTTGTPEQPNVGEPSETSSQKSKFRYLERAPGAATVAGYKLDRGDEYETAGRTASPGYWSLIHTGMQPPDTTSKTGTPWRTLNFGPANSQASPPDWLLLDLFGPTYPMAHDQWKIDSTLPDQFSTASYMNSTAGQVNLNSRIYPQNDLFRPPARTQPLTAVFKNLRKDDSGLSAFVDAIASYQNDSTVFRYIGELANIAGYSTGQTTWEQEEILRDMSGCLTTKSNTFGVWGVSQSIKQLPKNRGTDRFQAGDVVLAEKRFYALVERYIWPGKDGVPGNGHLDSTGKWDRIATTSAGNGNISLSDGITDTLFQLPGSPPLTRATGATRLQLDTGGTYAQFDGPQPVGMTFGSSAALGKVSWSKSSLEDAYNPPQPVIKYRVVYFKYLDE